MDNEAATAPTSSKFSATDDESISTSTTESETYESWTLVTDKHKKKQPETTMADTKSNDGNSKVEILNADKDNDPKADEEESTIDDLSDGISIISESESGGRISPHPSMLEHLSGMNMTFNRLEDVTPKPQFPLPATPIILSSTNAAAVNENNIRALRQRRISRSSAERKALQRHAETSVEAVRPAMPNGLKRICYAAFFVLAVGIFLRMNFPKQHDDIITDLKSRIEYLELQNKFLSDKVAIAMDKLQYWSTKPKERTHYDDMSRKHNGQSKTSKAAQKGETFKAWSGHGQTIDPVVITKSDLKDAYDCNVFDTCNDKPIKGDELFDEMAKTVNDVLEKSEVYQTFEDVVAEVETLTEDTLEKPPQKHESKLREDAARATSAEDKKQPQPSQKQEKRPKFRQNSMEDNAAKQQQQHHHHQHEHVKKQDKPWKQEKHEKHYRHKERDYSGAGRASAESHEHDDDDDDDDDKSFEKRHYDSKERFNKQHNRYNSKERYDSKDGDWHEQRMKNREYARRQNERQRDNKNWFIERGDSREQMRQS